MSRGCNRATDHYNLMPVPFSARNMFYGNLAGKSAEAVRTGRNHFRGAGESVHVLGPSMLPSRDFSKYVVRFSTFALVDEYE